ncbi:MAG TPA: TIGR01906 family membrane protein [Anaerolineales bacterium]|nr:TIGR01906 family membrane protein [Anaerolineales bacterium]HNF35931.1 TIGR01906 family membrane protein [Anaerolineales bacterium]HNH04608.1 TIGR01906 family membrane protein [Anaerolineales bacterium]HNH77095.1 TIGR01906 family membrane protein [Anaerolineales bacterium]HUM25769.1 TIGR01906 family membrane protein [Anaerolineales bacterium]
MKPSFLSYLVSLLTPVALIGAALRILLSPIYYNVEYRMPYFPVDEYGFTQQDRLQWAPYAVEYLVNSSDISYLGDLQFENGTPLYNERELSHMADVKNVVVGALRVWYLSLGLLALFAILAQRSGWMPDYLNGLRRGGMWMIGLAVALGLVAGIGITTNPDVFWEFFALFHAIFFEGDSWLFYYSDTLIRLFPIRFWQDAFLWAAILALGGGAGLAFGIRRRDS